MWDREWLLSLISSSGSTTSAYTSFFCGVWSSELQSDINSVSGTTFINSGLVIIPSLGFDTGSRLNDYINNVEK